MDKVNYKRSKLGLWLERHNKDIDWLSAVTGLKRKLIEELAANPDKSPRMITIRKILSAIKNIDPTIKVSDLWDMK